MESALQLVPSNDRQAHFTASGTTIAVAVAILLFVWLFQIETPIPPIPPDPEPPTIELDLGMIAGGTNQDMGGGSLGETGDPGTQPSDASNQDGGQTTSGVVTEQGEDSDVAVSPPSPNNAEPSVSDETLALMEKLKNKKGNTSIKIGGDGSGSPYTSGSGDRTGPDVGPNDGGIPGSGGDGGGKHYRTILYKPEIVNPTQEEAMVVVNVYVRRDGSVKDAQINLAGTTTANSVLHSTARQSAMKIKFDEDQRGPELLLIPININFTLK